MKKRFTSVIIVALAVIMSLCLFACGETTPPPSITLSQTEIALSVYDSEVLTASGADNISFTSSDDTVVSVDANGKLIGVGVGSATVTATSGSLSATCAVTVTAATSTPSLVLSADSVDLMTGNTYNLTASVSYKGATQSDATVTYSVADDSVATVAQNGQITAVAIGDTTVTVSASWRGADASILTEEVPVSVRGNVVINFSAEQINLATADMSADGGLTNEAELVASATVDGATATVSYEIDPDGDDGVITIEGNTLTAVKAGSTKVRAKVVSGGDNYYSAWRDVVVEYAVFDRTATTLEYLLTDDALAFDNETLLNGDTVLAIKDGETLVSEGVTLDKSKMTAGIRTYRVETENAAYLYTAEVITLKIMNKTDLDNMLTAMQVAGTTHKFDGYVTLGANINYEGAAYNYYSDSTRTLVRGEGFTGTFDGKGYTIYDIKFTDIAGMFGYPAQGAVIKNVALEDVSFANSGGANWGAMIFGQFCYATSIENVFISVKEVTGTARIIADDCGNDGFGITALNNVIIDATNFPSSSKIIASYGKGASCTNTAIITANDNVGNNVGAAVYADMNALMADISTMGLGSIWATSGARVGFNSFAPVIKNNILDNIALDDIETKNGEVTTIVANGAKYVSGTVEGGNGKVIYADGKLTVADDLAEDVNCTLTLSNALNPTDTVTINVIVDSFIIRDYTDEVTLEFVLTESALEVDIAELFDDADEVVKVTDIDNSVEISTSATLDKSKMAYGIHTYQIETANCAYKVKAEVITYKIMNKADLDGMLTAIAEDGATDSFDGYVTLGANINYGGASYDYGNGDATRTYASASGGFKGIFDGKGYTIYDIKIVNMAGLFGNTQDGAVIKNVAFENVVMESNGVANIYNGTGNNWYPTLFGYTFLGDALDNVYISIKSATDHSALFTMAGSKWVGTAIVNVSNVVVDGSGLPSNGILFTNHGNSKIVFNNVAVIAAADSNVMVLKDSASGTVNRVADMSALKTAVASMNLGSMWKIDGDRVSFASMAKEVKDVILPSAVSEVSGDNGDALTVLSSGYDFVKGSIEGGNGKITYANGKVMIADDLSESTTATLTLTSVFDATATKTVSITATKSFVINDLTSSVTLELLLANDTLTIDTATLFDDSSAVVKVTDVDNEVEISTSATLDKSKMAYGVHTYYIETANAGYKVKAEVITHKIMNATDLNNMLTKTAVPGTTNEFDGYVVLGASFNYNEASYDYGNGDATRTYASASGGFKGIFDGKGFTISGLKIVDMAGLFGNLQDGAVIKNVAFKDVVMEANGVADIHNGTGNNWYPTLFGYTNIADAIDNVFISIKSATDYSALSTNTGSKYDAAKTTTISNVIVDGSGLPTNGILFSNHNSSSIAFSNVAVIAAADSNVKGNTEHKITGTVNRVADMNALKTAAESMNLGSMWKIDENGVGFAK